MNPKIKAIYIGVFGGRRDKNLDHCALINLIAADMYFLFYYGGERLSGEISLQQQINSWSK